MLCQHYGAIVAKGWQTPFVSPRQVCKAPEHFTGRGVYFVLAAISHIISERTTMSWMHSLDISFLGVQKHIHIDDHEREYVVAYRQMFLKQKRKHEEHLPVLGA